ncbi:PCNA-associated factor [Penaeus vannamei]|uniref:PCNA-associated factor n=1 Tax=Penaeus vannamei TaxID=6689 RepID=A0A3R7MMR8_PENVA|nr:PCNA-associated factor-like [Penaeus vannamei]XP_027211907.1 PCNA-associated factor-like [Penaeus vannamei]ROT85878.1 PCNA-associated factor [Penaeus vannamei]
MVRTRADAGPTKVSAAKAPRKVLSAPSGGAGSSFSSPGRVSGKEKYSGGNSYNPQPTPEWQKGIGSFFKCIPKPQEGEGSSSSSSDKKETKPEVETGEGSSNLSKNGMISDEDDE